MTTTLTRGHAASHNEQALLRAAQRGDRQAQEELLRRYEPLVRHTVWRLPLPCRCDREDFAQDARLALLAADALARVSYTASPPSLINHAEDAARWVAVAIDQAHADPPSAPRAIADALA